MIVINYYYGRSGGLMHYIDAPGRKACALQLPEWKNASTPPQKLEDIKNLFGWIVIDPIKAVENIPPYGYELVETLILKSPLL